MVTYKDTTQVARNMWVSFIWTKPLGRMGSSKLKWLMIYLLIEISLCLCKGELFFEVLKGNCKMATKIIVDIDLMCSKV